MYVLSVIKIDWQSNDVEELATSTIQSGNIPLTPGNIGHNPYFRALEYYCYYLSFLFNSEILEKPTEQQVNSYYSQIRTVQKEYGYCSQLDLIYNSRSGLSNFQQSKAPLPFFFSQSWLTLTHPSGPTRVTTLKAPVFPKWNSSYFSPPSIPYHLKISFPIQ